MNLITKQIEKANNATNKLKTQRFKDTTERIDNILKDNKLNAGVIIDVNVYKQITEMFLSGNKIIHFKYSLWEDS